MKVTKSNPLGFGIHSPYVYHLVAKVIFGKKKSIPGNHPRCLFSGFGERERISQVLRLIDYFQPEIITLVGEGHGIKQSWCDSFQQLHCRNISSGEIKLSGIKKEFVIFDGFNGTLFEIPDYSDLSMWILFDLQPLELKALFNKLRNSKKVPLTIEVNRMGIVIFNRNLSKQDYHIRRWFLF